MNSEQELEKLIADKDRSSSAKDWIKLCRGIRYYEHPTQKWKRKPDRNYCGRFFHQGETVNIPLGWASEFKDEDEVRAKFLAIKQDIISGKRPASTKEAAEQVKHQQAALETEKRKQQFQEMTVREYWESYYKDFSRSGKKLSSFRPEEGHMNNWILPLFGETSIKDINLQSWDLLIKSLENKGRSQRSKNYVAGTFKRMLQHAQDRGIEIKLPRMEKIGAQPPTDNRRLRVLTKEEASAILKYLNEHDPHTARLTEFCMLTGCRYSEAANLRWRTIDLPNNLITFVKTKNKDNRTLPFDAGSRLAELLASRTSREPDEYVFPKNTGVPFTARDDRTDCPWHFVQAVKSLGLNEGQDKHNRVSFHSLRHTAATKLAGEDTRAKMDYFGWKSVQMAARYTHPGKETLVSLSKKLEKGISEGDNKDIIDKND